MDGFTADTEQNNFLLAAVVHYTSTYCGSRRQTHQQRHHAALDIRGIMGWLQQRPRPGRSPYVGLRPNGTRTDVTPGRMARRLTSARSP